MKITLKLLPYLFIQVLILMLVGMGEVLLMEWGLSKLIDAEFWFSYITLTLAGILSFFSWANMRIDQVVNAPYKLGMESDPNINMNDLGVIVAIKRNALNNLVLKHRTSDLPDFLKEINLEEKRNCYVYDVTNKLNKLRSRHTLPLNKIKYLESTISDEWLNEHLEHTHVKYVPVTEAYIINGAMDKRSTTFRHRSLSKSEKMINDNIHKWIMSLSYTLLVTSISFTVDITVLDVAVWYTILVKVGSCLIQGVLGINYAKSYINEKTIYELDDRLALFEAYLEWKKNKTKEARVDGN